MEFTKSELRNFVKKFQWYNFEEEVYVRPEYIYFADATITKTDEIAQKFKCKMKNGTLIFSPFLDDILEILYRKCQTRCNPIYKTKLIIIALSLLDRQDEFCFSADSKLIEFDTGSVVIDIELNKKTITVCPLAGSIIFKSTLKDFGKVYQKFLEALTFSKKLDVEYVMYSWESDKTEYEKQISLWNKKYPDSKLFTNSDTEDSVVYFALDSDKNRIGMCQGTIYTSGSYSRRWQWNLCVNIDRDLYIDAIYVDNKFVCKGIGVTLLSLVEDYLGDHYTHGKQNIYIRSLHSSAGWYYKSGYIPVYKGCDGSCKKCEDEPYVFRHEHCIWMAKPLDDAIDDEPLELELKHMKPDLSVQPDWIYLYSCLKMEREMFEVFKEHFTDFEDFKQTMTYPKSITREEKQKYFYKNIAPKFGINPEHEMMCDIGKYEEWYYMLISIPNVFVKEV